MGDQTERWRGRGVVDHHGEPVGTVADVYLDRQSGEPQWVLVDPGEEGSQPTFVPLAGASHAGEDVSVPFARAEIESAPAMRTGDELSTEDERRLLEHYGTRVGADAGTGPGGTKDVTAGEAMVRSEEELHVTTKRRAVERVRLRKHVVTEYVEQTVPVRREELRLEREAITGQNPEGTGEDPEVADEAHEIILYAEEVVIEKRVVPRERVRISKELITEERVVAEELRKERIETDGVEDPAG